MTAEQWRDYNTLPEQEAANLHYARDFSPCSGAVEEVGTCRIFNREMINSFSQSSALSFSHSDESRSINLPISFSLSAAAWIPASFSLTVLSWLSNFASAFNIDRIGSTAGQRAFERSSVRARGFHT